MPGWISRQAVLVFIVALQLLAPLPAPVVALAQNNTSGLPLPEVKPSAPEPVESLAAKFLSLLMFIAIAGGLAAVAFGIFKFVTGGEDAGKWIGRGIAGVVLGIGFWAVIKFFLT